MVRATTPTPATEKPSEATGQVVPLVIPAEAAARLEAVAKKLGIHPMVAYGMALGEFCEKYEEES